MRRRIVSSRPSSVSGDGLDGPEAAGMAAIRARELARRGELPTHLLQYGITGMVRARRDRSGRRRARGGNPPGWPACWARPCGPGPPAAPIAGRRGRAAVWGCRRRRGPASPRGARGRGVPVCQISIERKCDRFGFGYPTPWTTARSPESQSACRSFMAGCSPTRSSSLRTLSGSIRSVGRLLW